MTDSTPHAPDRSAPPQRIGIDARMLSPRPTGVGNYIAGVLLPLCTRYPETRFFLYSNSQVEFLAHANVTVREGGAKIGPLWLNAQLPAVLRADAIDVFWGANGVAPVITSCPTVVTVHDLVYRFAGETMSWQARWTKRVFQGWSVRQAAQVVAVSQATADDVENQYGRHVDAVIQPAVHATFRRRDAATVESARRQYGLPPRYWLFAGTLEPRKNLVNLLEAYMLSKAKGLDLPVLAMAGAAGWGAPRLNELIKDGETAGVVRRLGYVPLGDLAALYSGCEALWMPSRYEGFGMPLLEAQCCGAPVIHGAHASMVEAAAALGVATDTDGTSIAQTMERVVRGEAPLTCRLIDSSGASPVHASDRMWNLFAAAAAQRSAS